MISEQHSRYEARQLLPEHCPICDRTARQLARHGVTASYATRLRNRDLTICAACHAASTRARLALDLPANWSFTARELARSVRVGERGQYLIDLDRVCHAYVEWWLAN